MKQGRPKIQRVRLNLTLGEHLASAAKNHARDAEMNVSELISYLIRRELANPSVGLVKKSSVIQNESLSIL
jgi:post-segregation antitoxin (ccd killing protein)